jgi:hypothetical protein
MIAFIDGMLAGTSFSQSQNLNHFDELVEDLPSIVKTTLHIVKICTFKCQVSSPHSSAYVNNHGGSMDEFQNYCADLITKSLFSIEILCGCTQYFKPSSLFVEKTLIASRGELRYEA